MRAALLALVMVASVISGSAAGADSTTEIVPALEGRAGPIVAVVGRQLFVYGGRVDAGSGRFVRQGAIVDPASGKSREISEPRFEVPTGFASDASVVGDQVLLGGTFCRRSVEESEACTPQTPAAAIYDVGDDDWREIELPARVLEVGAGGAFRPVGVSPDRRVVFSLVRNQAAPTEYWLYSLATSRWTELPPTGLAPQPFPSCVIQDRLVVLTYLVGDGGAIQPTLALIDLLAESPAWSMSTPLVGAEFFSTGSVMDCMDDGVLVSGIFRMQNQQRFDLTTGAWTTPAAAPPVPESFVGATAVWTGAEMLYLTFRGDGSAAYDPATDTWRALPGVVPRVSDPLFWNGRAVVGIGPVIEGSDAFNTYVYRYVPPSRQ